MLHLGVYLMQNFVKIPCHQLAHPGMPARGEAPGRHREMLSDRAVCLMGAGGKEQQGESEGKSKCDLSEQGGKRACGRRCELNANNMSAWLRSSLCCLLWLHQILSSLHLCCPCITSPRLRHPAARAVCDWSVPNQ